MQNSTQTIWEGQGYWLQFQAFGDGLELLDLALPTPNYYHRKSESSYTVAWLLDGYFGTQKGIVYLNDMIARLSRGIKIANRLSYAPPSCTFQRAYKLSEFQNLPSLPKKKTKELTSSKYDDNVFWALKLEAIYRIRTDGWLDYDGFESWAKGIFIAGEHVKDRSTLKAKCKSIWNWYNERNWAIDERISTMTRSEAAAKATKTRQERVKASIQGAINILRLYDKKITASAIAEEAKISLKTAQKYFKEMKASGAI